MIHIDLTNCEENKFKAYLGRNGRKRCIIYDGNKYMVKYPQAVDADRKRHSNNCISEYIGCHVFELAGIPVQETFLATMTENGKTRVVVACKDLESHGTKLIPFAGLKNTITGFHTKAYETELSDLLETFRKQEVFTENVIKTRFWETFIVDALLADTNRHNENWGYLYNETEKSAELAPVYDCDSCLYPQLDEKQMQAMLESPTEMSNLILESTSAIKENGKGINYKEFLDSAKNTDCNCALTRIYPKLSQEKIDAIIDGTPYISDLQKLFYKKIMAERRKTILEPTFEKLG